MYFKKEVKLWWYHCIVFSWEIEFSMWLCIPEELDALDDKPRNVLLETTKATLYQEIV